MVDCELHMDTLFEGQDVWIKNDIIEGSEIHGKIINPDTSHPVKRGEDPKDKPMCLYCPEDALCWCKCGCHKPADFTEAGATTFIGVVEVEFDEEQSHTIKAGHSGSPIYCQEPDGRRTIAGMLVAGEPGKRHFFYPTPSVLKSLLLHPNQITNINANNNAHPNTTTTTTSSSANTNANPNTNTTDNPTPKKSRWSVLFK